MLAQRIDFNNPDYVLMARVAFVVVQVLCFLTGKYLQSQVEARKDERVMYVAPPSMSMMSMLGGGGAASAPKSVKKTTYYQFEKEKAGQMAQQSLVNACLMAFMSYQFSIHLPLVMQVVLSPFGLITDPLLGRYVRGIEKVGAYDESLDIPAGATVVADAGAGADAGAAAPAAAVQDAAPAGAGGKRGKKVGKAAAAAQATAALKALIDSTWTANTTTDVAGVAALVEAGADINVTTEPDNWTITMVSCGLPANSASAIQRLMVLGGDVMMRDGDGWTALHWSAQNGALNAAKGLLASAEPPAQLQLLGVLSKEGEIALEVAVKAKQAECSVYLQDLTKSLTSVSEAPEAAAAGAGVDADAAAAKPSQVRQRKPLKASDIADID